MPEGKRAEEKERHAGSLSERRGILNQVQWSPLHAVRELRLGCSPNFEQVTIVGRKEAA